MTSTTPRSPRSRTRVSLAVTAVVLAVLVVLFFIFASLYTDALWFDQLGFLPVLTTQWTAMAGMFLLGLVGMALPVFISIQVAFRRRPVYAKLNSQLDRYQQVIEPLRRLAMLGIPLVLGVFMGVSTATRWPTVLQYINRTPFGVTDPQFGLDNSFYVYELPFYHGLLGYASAVVLIAGVAAIATSYLYGGIRVAGREVRITRATRVQLAITAAVYLIIQGVSIWFDQYSTLTDPGGASSLVTGVTYTDANAVIPGRLVLAIAAILVAVLFLVTAAVGRWRLPLLATGILVVSSLIVGSVYPGIIQRFQVSPSERTLEAPFIERNISATRAAFGVDDIDVQEYQATTDAEAGALREDAETTANIRILDPALVSRTFSQLEQVQQYYQFANNLDVDRYDIDGRTQDTVIAVRELNQANQSAQGWYNNTLVYTHGYGIVAAYGNQRSADGQPVFLESGIPVEGQLGDFEPRVYFGESSPSYSIVGTQVDGEDVELDYPGGEDDSDAAAATTTFQGDGGPTLDNFFKRLVYALKFQSEQLVLSDAVTNDSQVLYNRDPLDRIRQVAPYLTLDQDPYPAVVDGKILWLVDGYTTTSNYPYSQQQSLPAALSDSNAQQTDFGNEDINYMRNSVKATVDAYSGEVTLYEWDAEDPVLNTWSRVFPDSLESRSEMSEDLLAHVRYPADLFKVQRQVLEAYHVTNPGTFFSGDDRWNTPNDPTAGSDGGDQPPYYLTMKVPGTDAPAFSLYTTFIPQTTANSEARSVLRGYLTANSDAGDDYGKLTLLTLPKQDTVPGPGQVQNAFTSDSEVAAVLNILERGGTEVIRGNLLTLPIGGGLLYVQPVYVQSSSGTSFPLIRKIQVGFGDRIAFEDTLDAALDQLFQGDSGAAAGDNGVPGTTPTTPTDPSAPPTDPTAPPTDPGAGGDADVQAALAEYQEALADREAAYATNDLVAAAEADARMQQAVERVLAALGG